MKKAKQVLCLLLALAMACTLLACGGSQSGTPTGGDTQQTSNVRSDVNLFITADMNSWDPAQQSTVAESAVMQQVYDTFLMVELDGTVTPWIAESWDISDDGITYTFKIRQGVKFHNGDVMTTEDVAWSIDQFRASPYVGDMLQAIDNVTAVDDSTVVVTLSGPDGGFLMNVAVVWVMDKAYMESVGDGYFDAPVGSGPYQYVSYTTGDKLVLKAFDEYWGGAPAIKDVTYRIIPDSNTATISIQTGDIDFGSISLDSYDNVAADANLTMEGVELESVGFLIFNTTIAPFDDLKVRQALSYAIDKQFIIDTALSGHATPASAVVSPAAFHDMTGIQEYYHYDPDKGAALLAEAGQTGLKVNIKTIAAYETFAAVVQQQLKAIGVEATITTEEINTLVAELSEGDFEMAVMGISLGGDPSIFSIMLGSGAPFNLAHYDDPEIDALFAKAAVTTDPAERHQVFVDIFNRSSESAANVPVYWPMSYFAWNKALSVDILNGSPFVKDMYWN